MIKIDVAHYAFELEQRREPRPIRFPRVGGSKHRDSVQFEMHIKSE